MASSISQMQMLYNPEEDRLLFRVNSTDHREFRFWLTRRFVLLLLKTLQDHLMTDPDVTLQASEEARQAVMEFKKEQAIGSADFKQPFKDRETRDFPLGVEAQVAYKITCNKAGDNIQLGIHPKSGQGINMVISRELNTTLTQLIMNAVKQADWQLDNALAKLVKHQQAARVIN